MPFLPWRREPDLNAFEGAANQKCFNHVFPLVSTHSGNKYLSRWMNARISFGLKLSPLLASHIFHWWVSLTCRLPCREHRGVSSCLPALPSLHWVAPSHSSGCAKYIGHRSWSICQPFAGEQFGALFSGGQQYCQDLVRRDALRALQEPDTRLNQTLAWHCFNYSVGQRRVLRPVLLLIQPPLNVVQAGRSFNKLLLSKERGYSAVSQNRTFLN